VLVFSFVSGAPRRLSTTGLASTKNVAHENADETERRM